LIPPADKDLVLDLRPGGTAEEIARRFPPPAYFTAYLDGAAVPDKAALIEAMAAAFKFPSYFGKNWDALLDCLRSLPEFNPAGGYVLAIKSYSGLLARCPGERSDFTEVVSDAAGFLKGALGVTFRLVLY
jgi:hypothetical protein